MTNDIAIFREQLDLADLEKAFLNSDLPCAITSINHIFGGGVYAREMHAPADTLIIGKRHRHATCNMLLSGELSVYTEPDKSIRKVVAPCTFITKPGTKKFIYTHTDVIFTTIHPTESEDLDEIEKEFIITEEEWKLQLPNKEEGIKCLG
jgi:hypothetical protein